MDSMSMTYDYKKADKEKVESYPFYDFRQQHYLKYSKLF